MDWMGWWEREEGWVGGRDEGLGNEGWSVGFAMVGEETFRCCGDGWAGWPPLGNLRAADALPGTVCLSVSGGTDGRRVSLVDVDEGEVLPSAPRTSFREIFGPADGVRQGDAGFSARGGPFSGEERGSLLCSSCCCCCCLFRSRCDILFPTLIATASAILA